MNYIDGNPKMKYSESKKCSVCGKFRKPIPNIRVLRSKRIRYKSRPLVCVPCHKKMRNT